MSCMFFLPDAFAVRDAGVTPHAIVHVPWLVVVLVVMAGRATGRSRPYRHHNRHIPQRFHAPSCAVLCAVTTTTFSRAVPNHIQWVSAGVPFTIQMPAQGVGHNVFADAPP